MTHNLFGLLGVEVESFWFLDQWSISAWNFVEIEAKTTKSKHEAHARSTRDARG